MKGLLDGDQTLESCKTLAVKGTTKYTADGEVSFIRKKGVLYRLAKNGEGKFKQLLVPKTKPEEVLRLAHESLLGGHLGMAKTKENVVKTFYLPGVHGDVKNFCLSCNKCQRMSPRTNHRPVPLGVTPIIDEPFSRVAVDLIEPIKPASKHGNQYPNGRGLRYSISEAVFLKRIDAETVAEALLGIGLEFPERSSPIRVRSS